MNKRSSHALLWVSTACFANTASVCSIPTTLLNFIYWILIPTSTLIHRHAKMLRLGHLRLRAGENHPSLFQPSNALSWNKVNVFHCCELLASALMDLHALCCNSWVRGQDWECRISTCRSKQKTNFFPFQAASTASEIFNPWDNFCDINDTPEILSTNFVVVFNWM